MAVWRANDAISRSPLEHHKLLRAFVPGTVPKLQHTVIKMYEYHFLF